MKRDIIYSGLDNIVKQSNLLYVSVL